MHPCMADLLQGTRAAQAEGRRWLVVEADETNDPVFLRIKVKLRANQVGGNAVLGNEIYPERSVFLYIYGEQEDIKNALPSQERK